MIKISIDVISKRVTVMCNHCEVPILYNDGHISPIICPHCCEFIDPRPETLRSNPIYRIVFHKEGDNAKLHKNSYTVH